MYVRDVGSKEGAPACADDNWGVSSASDDMMKSELSAPKAR